MKKWKCPYCPKKYQSKDDWYSHIKKIHDVDKETVDSIEEFAEGMKDYER